MKKLEIKLKQHTPLIHFQHDQEGATLRASEVKPKLDRFILAKLGYDHFESLSDDEFDKVVIAYNKENRGKDLYDLDVDIQEKEVGKYIARKKGWLIGKGEHFAFDYKMRIETEPNSRREDFLLASYLSNRNRDAMLRQRINVLGNTPYFAQEKENGEIAHGSLNWNNIGKKGIIESGKIIVSIALAMNPKEGEKDQKEEELAKYIANQIQSFFLSTNFGTRQSKGFGSFTVVAINCNGSVMPLADNEKLLKENFQFVYKRNESVNSLEMIFSSINDDYRLLKSGRRRPYAKSKMMLFAKKENKGWDKKFIKTQFNSIPRNRYRLRDEHPQESYTGEDSYNYYRALLGLAEQLEFLLENNNSKAIFRISHPDIQRYQSPILFKVVDNFIYLVGNDVSKNMLNKAFSFSVSVKGDHQFNNIGIAPIQTPLNFSLKNFIRFAMKDESQNAHLPYKQIK